MFHNHYHYGASKYLNKIILYKFFLSITGLMILVTTNPTDGELYFTKDLVWTDYANPCLLIILYFYLALKIRRFQQVTFIENFSYCLDFLI